MTSSHNISIAIDGLKDIIHNDVNNDGETKADETVANVVSKFTNKTPMQILDMFMSDSSGKREAIYNGKNKNTPSYSVPYYQRMNEGNWK